MSLSLATCPNLPRTQHSARDSKYLPCKNIKKKKKNSNNEENNNLNNINYNNNSMVIGLCELFQYTQLIKEPTRVTLSTNSLIDILTNEPVKFATSGVSPIGCSDHSLIYVSRKLTCLRSIPRIIESRQYKNFMPDDFVNDMALVPWDTIEQIDNPTGACMGGVETVISSSSQPSCTCQEKES